MAAKITTKHATKRGDFLFLHPDDVVVDAKLRGRHKAPDDSKVESLAASILEHGQLQAVQGRKRSDGRVQLVYGYTRYAAVQLLREQGHDTLLKLALTSCNDQEAFLANVVENKHRNETTPIDDAHNQRRLKEEYGMSDADIAKLYRCSAAWVMQTRKLLSLPGPVQKKVEAGQLPVSAALALADVEPEKQKELIAEATEGKGGKVSGTKLKSLLRNETEANGETPEKSQVRTIREIRGYLEDISQVDSEETAVKDFAQSTLEWVNGRKSDKQFYNAIYRLGGLK